MIFPLLSPGLVLAAATTRIVRSGMLEFVVRDHSRYLKRHLGQSFGGQA
jgi:ABC-type dipeptide/oligopeptide/nickel transport system permease component